LISLKNPEIFNTVFQGSSSGVGNKGHCRIFDLSASELIYLVLTKLLVQEGLQF
jgi:hypothetical protein